MRQGIFTPEELNRLLSAAQENVPDVLGFLVIGAFAGLRMAEIERLTWGTTWIWKVGSSMLARRRRKSR